MGAAAVDRDLELMRRCLARARAAGSRGESPVGSLVTVGGRVVGEAEERVAAPLDVAGHAEIRAIRRACCALGARTLPGATLYTTAEPSLMCAFAIRETGVGRVVFGAAVPAVGGATSAYPILAADVAVWPAPPTIVRGVLREACEALFSAS